MFKMLKRMEKPSVKRLLLTSAGMLGLSVLFTCAVYGVDMLFGWLVSLFL